MAGMRRLRAVGSQWHQGIAALPDPIAGFYLHTVGALLKRLPDSQWKQRIVNSITPAPWKSTLHLAPQQVKLGSDITIQLVPHLQEFDFNALFFQQLPYEAEVFEVIRQRFATYDAIIEIGANVGVFTLFFGKVAERLRTTPTIITFEPSRKAYNRSLTNLELNGLLSKITSFNSAVADNDGFVTFYEPEGHLTNGSLDADFSRQFADSLVATTVQTIQGDTLLQLVADKQKILLKIDVEGIEPRLLRSMQTLIDTKRPDIVVEVLPATVDDLNTLDFLTSTYQLFNITSQGLQAHDRFVASEYRDYLLLPHG